jgi:hypothetical protein
MQGNINDMILHILHSFLSLEGLKHLDSHLYVGADQIRPILEKYKKWSWRIKLMIINEEAGMQGNGSQDRQSR